MPTGDFEHGARCWNERVELVATLFNSVATVTLAAALINPIASKRTDVGSILLFGAAVSHVVGQVVLTFFHAEE